MREIRMSGSQEGATKANRRSLRLSRLARLCAVAAGISAV